MMKMTTTTTTENEGLRTTNRDIRNNNDRTISSSSSGGCSSSSTTTTTTKTNKTKPGMVVTILLLVIGTSTLVLVSMSTPNNNNNNSIRRITQVVLLEIEKKDEGEQTKTTNSSTTTTTTTTMETMNQSTTINTITKDRNDHDQQQQQQRRRGTKPRYFGHQPVTNQEHEILLRYESLSSSSVQRYNNKNNSSSSSNSSNNSHHPTTFAVCHPTLFGDVKFHRVLSFVSYYRLLGFQHVFLWIERRSSSSTNTTTTSQQHRRRRRGGGVSWTPLQYQQLQSLKYVTLTEYNTTTSSSISSSKNKNRIDYHGQSAVQDMCRSDPNFAANYDWNLVVDVDEYLWLGHQHRTVQEFMDEYNPNNQYTYISFGKWQYSPVNILKDEYDDVPIILPPSSITSPSINASEDTDRLLHMSDIVNRKGANIIKIDHSNVPMGHFGVDRYAFTPKLYCFKGKNNGSNQHKNFQWQNSHKRQPHPTAAATTTFATTNDADYCPDWPGRCKILSKSSNHASVAVHGYDEGLNSPDGIHWNHQTAHIKEWPGIGVVGCDFDVDVDDERLLLFRNDSMTSKTTNTKTNTNGICSTRVFVRSSRKPFAAQNNSEVEVHSLQEAFRRLANGSVPVFYDKRLKSWMDFVASRILSQQER